MKTFQLAILFTIILAFMITYFQEPRGLSTQEPDTLTVPLTFAEPPEHADGKRIFKTECAACHMFDRQLTGPALYPSFQQHDAVWLYTYLTPSYDTLKMKEHPLKFRLSQKEVDELHRYVMEESIAID